MKTHLKKIVFITIILSILIANKHYALTSFNIPFFNTPNGYVRIDFINKSNEKITAIKLDNNNISIKNIKPNKRKTLFIKPLKTGTYDFTVLYASGKTISSQGAYIDGGFFIKEYILNHTTRIEQSFL